jgi:hypothetical protein
LALIYNATPKGVWYRLIGVLHKKIINLFLQPTKRVKYNYLNARNVYGIKMDPNVISMPPKGFISLTLVKYA